MPSGICALCKQDKNLVDSHFLPAATYRPLHASGLPVNDPMVMTHKRVYQSSRQITAQAFCNDCETCFNQRGESWVLSKLATPTSFSLRDIVTATPPEINEPDFRAFACNKIPEFRFERVVHFSMGLFWKAAAYTWNIIDGPLPRIKLGPYEEPIREFVLGIAAFPKNICLVTYLDASNPPLIATTPPRKFQKQDFHLFGFYINGLECLLCVGKKAPVEVADLCLATSPHHPVFVVPETGNKMFKALSPLTSKSKLSNGMRRTFEQWIALH
jgi:hypothetical protein